MVHGAGALESVAPELERLGGERVLLLTTGSLSRDGRLLAQLRSRIGGRLVGEFDRCEQHTPRTVVLAAAAAAREVQATAILAAGGSSVVDAAKGVALAIAENLLTAEDFDTYRLRDRTRSPAAGTLPVIAVPTTLSGAEYSNVAGILDPARTTKDLFHDDRLAIRTIILDPSQADATPAELWAATGVKSLGGAIEKLYSRSAHPVVDALSLEGIRLLNTSLEASVGGDLGARLQCYIGAWLSNFAGPSARTAPGIAAALRHEVGAVSGAAHGNITCVLMPHILRFNLQAADPRQVAIRLAAALDVTASGTTTPRSSAVDACTDRLDELVRLLGLPTRLREIGVAESDLRAIAEHTLEGGLGGNPREVSSADEIAELLRHAY